MVKREVVVERWITSLEIRFPATNTKGPEWSLLSLIWRARRDCSGLRPSPLRSRRLTAAFTNRPTGD
jgi:hypothetical protein